MDTDKFKMLVFGLAFYFLLLDTNAVLRQAFNSIPPQWQTLVYLIGFAYGLDLLLEGKIKEYLFG